MRKILYQILEDNKSKFIEFITDRSPEWTEEQYLRHRPNTTMKLISNEATEEKESLSREVRLG